MTTIEGNEDLQLSFSEDKLESQLKNQMKSVTFEQPKNQNNLKTIGSARRSSVGRSMLLPDTKPKKGPSELPPKGLALTRFIQRRESKPDTLGSPIRTTLTTEREMRASERIAIPRPSSNRPRKESLLGITMQMPLSTRSGGISHEMFSSILQLVQVDDQKNQTMQNRGMTTTRPDPI